MSKVFDPLASYKYEYNKQNHFDRKMTEGYRAWANISAHAVHVLSHLWYGMSDSDLQLCKTDMRAK